MESPDFYKSGAERIKVVMARLDVVGAELETLLVAMAGAGRARLTTSVVDFYLLSF